MSIVERSARGLATLALVALPACVTKSDGDLLRSDVDQLKAEVSAIQSARRDERAAHEARLATMEKRAAELEATLTSIRQADADHLVQMEKVVAELQILRGEIEEARFALNETKDQLGETKRSVQDILARPPMEVQAAAGAAKVDAAAAATTVAGSAIPDDKQAHYDLAKKLFDDGNHDAAIQAFDLFLQRHKEPDARDGKGLVDNAHFWLGEAHYARAKGAKDEKDRSTGFKRAILSYQKVLETPGSNKADGALLKIGLAFEAVGYADEAKVFYEEILANHPKSPLAKDAKERITILAKNAKPKGKKTK